MNYSDAERTTTILKKHGWSSTAKLETANVVLLFTCSVRQKAEDRVFGELKKLKKWKSKQADRQIGITGCMIRQTSHRDSPEQDKLLKRSSLVDFVWKIENTSQLPKLLGKNTLMLSPKKAQSYFTIPPIPRNTTQVLVPIMTGCDNFCTYCIVPYARGHEISRPEEEILTECRQAVKNGAIEITLLGQNVNSFQKKRGSFAKLLKKIAQIPHLQRVRFISSHPKDFDESVIETMQKFPNIERHLHLPAQHGDDEILQRMNRGYTTTKYLNLIAKFREKLPSASITTDLIVGFPGETDENFQNLLNFYRKAQFDFCFLSKYSPRIGTPAAIFPNQISLKKKAERWHILNKLVISTTHQKYLKLKNKTFDILVEKHYEGICRGRSSESFLVKFHGQSNLVGKIVHVKITHPRDVELFGKINSDTFT